MADPWDGLLLEWASTLGKSQKDWDQRDEGIWPAVAQAPVRTSLYRRAFKKLWSAEDAKDVVQTTLYQLAVGDTYRPSARGAIGFKVWVFGALDNRIASFLESSRHTRTEVAIDGLAPISYHSPGDAEVALVEQLDFERAMAQCDPVLRSILELTREGHRAREIAKLTGLK
jgi:DNA-directed RNA polymerase specialized sigma24 family protein